MSTIETAEQNAGAVHVNSACGFTKAVAVIMEGVTTPDDFKDALTNLVTVYVVSVHVAINDHFSDASKDKACDLLFAALEELFAAMVSLTETKVMPVLHSRFHAMMAAFLATVPTEEAAEELKNVLKAQTAVHEFNAAFDGSLIPPAAA